MTKPPVPWWNRKRCLPVFLAAAASLAVSVPLLLGPTIYCAQRRWMSLPTLNILYRPVVGWVPDSLRPAYGGYLDWWVDLGMRHDAEMRLRQRKKGEPPSSDVPP